VGDAGRVATTAQWIAEDTRRADRDSWLVVWLLLGTSVAFTMISIANTQLMAAGQRAGDVAILRRVGATPAQTVRAVVWETCACVLVGSVLGTVTAIASMVGVWWGLRLSNPFAVLRVPWLALAGVVAVCLVVAVGTAVASVLRAARSAMISA
jgi:putative ABC transport system permease protein